MATSTELSQLNPDKGQWILPTLVSAAILASDARMESQSEPLCAETAQLLAKETAKPKKVISTAFLRYY